MTEVGDDTDSGITFRFDNTMNIVRVVIVRNSVSVFDNIDFFPMLRYAEITDDFYNTYKSSIEERLPFLKKNLRLLREAVHNEKIQSNKTRTGGFVA
ncbi:MAG: hypothetical protein NC042_07585 [Ruminococcus flavefaciens]|nr:hypothetical protein [Ruminococcus flavefaciens]